MVPGMSDEAWLEFCRKNGEDTYRFCTPVPQVTAHAEELRRTGAVLFVLSASQSEEENAAKRKFVRVNMPGLFEEVITVDADDKKIPTIRRIAEERGVALSDCEIVEDTYGLVLKATVAGINATHVSHLCCKRD